MSESTPLGGNGLPAAAPVPQVMLSVIDGQVQLQSNIEVTAEAWLVIAQICTQGSMLALQQATQAQQQGAAARIVVPTLQVKGLH